MKCMILTYASQQGYDGMAGKATDLPAWSPEGFAAMGLFKEAFKRQLVESGESIEARAFAAPLHTRRLGVQSSLPFVIERPVRRNPGCARRLLDRGMRPLRPGDEIAGRLAGCTAPEHVVANRYADVRPIMESAAEASVSDEGR
jgi:hypothetical protein